MEIKKYKMLLPPIVLLVLSAWTFIRSTQEPFMLTTEHYGGLAAALTCIICFFTLRKYYRYVLITTLIFGLLNMINFTPWSSKASFFIGSFGIGFQPTSFWVSILTVLLRLPKRSEVKVVNSENVAAGSQKQYKEDVDRFKALFESKSDQELTAIIEDRRFTTAAKEAATAILSERAIGKGGT